MEYLNVKEKFTADCILKVTFGSYGCHCYHIYCDGEESGLEELFNHFKSQGLLETSDSLEEDEIQDYMTIDGENYIPYSIMRDQVELVDNKDKLSEYEINELVDHKVALLENGTLELISLKANAERVAMRLELLKDEITILKNI